MGSQVLQDVMARLDKAMKAFFQRVKNKRGKAGFPRFKARARYDSFTLSQAGWKLEGRHLKIKGVGTFKLRLSRPIEGKIKTVTVRRDNCGGWWVSFSCEVEAKPWPDPAKPLVGIDVGLKHFCVDSDPDSQPVANPRYYRQAQVKLRRQQRKVARRKKGSAKCRQAVKALARTHRRIADMRRDFLHKTANHYIKNYQEIRVEDLKVSNMVKNRQRCSPHPYGDQSRLRLKGLSKSIADAGWATFFELLCAKAEEAGRTVVKVAPHGTSQNCSVCGERVPKKLAVRVHRCHVCGLVLDRDVNAARNIQAG
ncbi:MAG: RNA-guided endonuclease InsQ/TnpB family protein [Candidatus Sericytochromatia bacterium]